MVAIRVVVCFAVLAASAAAITVQQCKDKSIENLSENVQLSPCKKIPCPLKKGTNQAITVTFITEKDIPDVTNRVTAKVFGVDVPFIGVDGTSICEKLYFENGDKASCPLKAGTKYTYKDTFPVLSIYPTLSVKVHWALQDGSDDQVDLTCFEVPVRIM